VDKESDIIIKENGIKAFSDLRYSYYELQQDFGILKRVQYLFMILMIKCMVAFQMAV
jgi:hypothetical protein